MYGTYETVGGRPAVLFERHLPHPVERVWRAITDPAELAHWFPSQVSGELRPGGVLRFSFPAHELPDTEGEITELEPPRRLAFWWGAEHLRFELEPEGDGCVLRLTHVLSAPDQAARDSAGWHVCLERLERTLAGEDATAPGTEPTGEWRALYEEYERRGLPTGAEIPG